MTKEYSSSEIVESGLFNKRLSSVFLSGQTVSGTLFGGEPVYYDTSISTWILSNNKTPHGVYIVNVDLEDIIVLFGYASNMSGLVAGQEYFMNAAGALVTDIEDSHNNTRIGRAISATELLVDIDLLGDVAPIKKA